MSNNTNFNYTEAFSRNLGWFSLQEQKILKQKRVAISGLGGVGGSHLLALARLGIEHFHIADLDTFDVGNFNRQAGAMMSTLKKSKVSVMARMASDINPNICIKEFNHGINQENIDEFLNEVDLVIDGLDIYAPKARRMLFSSSYEKNIPLITAGPLGNGSAYLVWNEDSPHPDAFFDFKSNQSDMDMLIQFIAGLAPKGLQAKYMLAKTHINPNQGKVCSLSAGVYMASSIVVTKSIQILLNRGQVLSVPHYQQFDAYLNQYVRGKLRWGNRSLLQKIKIKFIKKAFKELEKTYVPLQADCLNNDSVEINDNQAA